MQKHVLILGANSDVAKAAIPLYVAKGYHVMAASRNTVALQDLVEEKGIPEKQVTILSFDAADFEQHADFYQRLPAKPHIVLYAAGFLKNNEEALHDWSGSYQMMQVHYCGAVSILNIIATDTSNTHLEKIVGLSSLSGVRGRKSNFIYGSTKAAFTQYLAGLRQHLFQRRITVNVVVAGYIRSKMTAGLDLPESLMLEPSFIAQAVVGAGNGFVLVPGYKWKVIYHILRLLPEKLVARLP
ncbi:SDR family NAD(P)-dependent oxidoreductase [Chitinophaga sp. Mgbs1]|uniref:SDR family NAD(P)-dependent oxidoreductase n=1 Tax=Chitinophaga solisilvae TaxID=1233460 RepID=A0A9Q5D493_9BACT|nr:SDR family NAD(P)-dependent oxidoreductase [Chitinophaga solisilvae]